MNPFFALAFVLLAMDATTFADRVSNIRNDDTLTHQQVKTLAFQAWEELVSSGTSDVYLEDVSYVYAIVENQETSRQYLKLLESNLGETNLGMKEKGVVLEKLGEKQQAVKIYGDLIDRASKDPADFPTAPVLFASRRTIGFCTDEGICDQDRVEAALLLLSSEKPRFTEAVTKLIELQMDTNATWISEVLDRLVSKGKITKDEMLALESQAKATSQERKENRRRIEEALKKEPVPKSEAIQKALAQEQAEAEQKSSAETKVQKQAEQPIWLWVAIGVGVFFLGLGAVIAYYSRRRK